MIKHGLHFGEKAVKCHARMKSFLWLKKPNVGASALISGGNKRGQERRNTLTLSPFSSRSKFDLTSYPSNSLGWPDYGNSISSRPISLDISLPNIVTSSPLLRFPLRAQREEGKKGSEFTSTASHLLSAFPKEEATEGRAGKGEQKRDPIFTEGRFSLKTNNSQNTISIFTNTPINASSPLSKSNIIRPYIKKGRHIINLLKTRRCLNQTLGKLTKYALKGRSFLFIGTKKTRGWFNFSRFFFQ